jgi:hypothetical protein
MMDTAHIGAREGTTAPVNGQPVTARDVRETIDRLYPRRVEFPPPPPPTERPHGMEESLDGIYGRVVTYLEAVEQKGGIKVMTQDWTQERKQDYLQKVAEIQARWNALAEEAQQAWPQASLTLVGASTNGNRPFRQERGPEGEKSRAPDDPA